MPTEPTEIEVIQEDYKRFLVRRFADGTEERVPIIKQPRKPPRYPYRTVTLDKTRKKGF